MSLSSEIQIPPNPDGRTDDFVSYYIDRYLVEHGGG